MQVEENIRKVVLFLLEIAAMILLYTTLNSVGIYKYIVLCCISIFLLVINHQKLGNVLPDCYLVIPILLYCGMGIVLSIFGGTMTEWTIKTLGFWTLPPVFSALLCITYDQKRGHMIDMQFYGCILAYLLPILEWFLFGGGVGESIFAFSLGLFAVYYIWKHKWLHAVIAAFFMYYADKRIVTLAVILCICLILFMKLVKYSKKLVKVLWSLLIAASCFYVYSIYSGLFERFCGWVGINTTYRLNVYSQLAAHIPENYYVGKGIGTANEMIVEFVDPWLIWAFENPHNDLLKIFIELGAIGLVLFLTSYLVVFKIAEKKLTQRALSQLFVIFVYFVLLMTTDNVSIYILFLVPMHSICFALAGEKKESQDENHAK